MDKPYTTYEEQVEILREKGLLISNDDEVIALLKKCSYFGLVTGYKHPFKNKNGCYKFHTTINDIYAFYNYDMELRELFLKYILMIENHIKSLISYYFCQTYGDLETDYLNANNYDYNEQKQDDINKLIGKLRYSMTNYDSHPYLQHHRDRYGNIPLWVLTRVLTLGIVSKMYSLLQPQTQTLISKEFPYISESELARMIDLLSRFRNVCAHNERLYDYKYMNGEIRNTAIHKLLELRKQKGYYTQGKNDLFAVVIVFKYMLSEQEFSLFIKKFDEITTELFQQTHILQESQVLKLMGFPLNWREIEKSPKEIII